jgi:predicted esterase
VLRRSAIVACLLAVCVPAAPALGAKKHRVDGKLGDWRGKPTQIAGKTTTSRGEYIYTDWLYDDHGPNLDGIPGQPQYRAALMPLQGDYTYPGDEKKYGYNAADLRELRVAADRRGLHFLISLQTLQDRDAAVVGIAIDGDRSQKTSRRWPDGSGLTAKGAERFVTTWGARARYTGHMGRSRRIRSAVNMKANAIEVFLPTKRAGKLARRPRIWVATGLNDGKGRFQAIEEGEAAAFNAGFRKETYPRLGSAWNEEEQSKALASGDISAFAGSFDRRRLKRRRSNRVAPLEPGFYNRIFRSRADYGEGIALKSASGVSIGGSPDAQFKSRWQPYGLYIPKGWKPGTAAPLTLNGHSLDCNMNEYANVAPRQFEQLGDERGSIIVTPLARGSDTWYLDSGFQDTMGAWGDVRKHYEVDEERTAITGYSMGGYMTYRLGLLMPDRFSRASAYVGPPAYQLWPYPAPIVPGDPKWTVPGNTNQIVENAYNLPFEIVHGNADELVPVSGVQHQADTFQSAGNEFRFFRHSADDHLSFVLNDEWSRTRDWLGTAPRDLNPTTVVYRRFPSMDLPQHGYKFDRAYWVSGIELRSAPAIDSSGRVRATTFGRGGNRKRAELQLPQPVTGPVTPGVLTAQKQVPGAALAQSNRFEADLENVGAVSFDAARMALDPRAPLTLKVTSDGQAAVTLLGDFGAVTAGALPVSGTDGRVTVTFPAGTTEVTLTPAG